MLPIEKYILRQYVHCATRRGYLWQIDDTTFLKLIDQPCVYCGTIGGNKAERKQYAVKERTYNGIDRIDSSDHYTEENTVSCCGACNAAKSDMSVEAFKNSAYIARRRQALRNIK